MTAWLGQLARPALLLIGMVAAGLLLRWVGMDAVVARAGEQGPGVFVVLGSVACAVGVPRQVVAYAAGLAFGFWTGAGLAMLAELAGCTVDFYWARLVARRWAAAYLARGGRAARLERFLVANAFSATLTLRLLPLGSNIALNLLAGVSAVSMAPFLLASAIGYVPQTIVFALLGGGVRVSQTTQIAVAAALMLLSVGLGVLLLRRRGVPA